MPLFLLIPLALLVLTIALAPVLAVAVVPDGGARAGHDGPVRHLERAAGGPARRQIRRSTRNDPHAPSSTNSPESSAPRQMS